MTFKNSFFSTCESVANCYRRRLPPEVDASELASAIYERMLEKLGLDQQWTPENFQAFGWCVFQEMCRRTVRNRMQPLGNLPDLPAPEEKAWHEEGFFLRLRRELNVREQAVLDLVWSHGYFDRRLFAEMLGIRVRAVDAIWQRIKHRAMEVV